MQLSTSMVSHFLLFVLLVVSLADISGQVTLSSFPQNKQLYPRDLGASTAPCIIEGTVAAGQGSISLSAKLYQGARLVEEKSVSVDASTTSADFSLTLSIPVVRKNHRVVLHRSGVSNPLAEAQEVVAGDVYVVNGQSNAIAGFAIAEVDRDSFLRGVLFNGEWTLMQLTGAGQWMGHAAKLLSNRHDVPIAALNFAVGAQRIDFFLPQPSGQGNFAEVDAALTRAGVKGKVRGLCWYQGEADGWEASIRSYREDLTSLFEFYDQEFSVDRFYAFQTRTYSCGHLMPFVMEAQRRLNNELNYLDVIASTNVVHDSCHFPYEQGYQLLGQRLADVISLREHNMGNTSALSPDIDSARITGDNEITLYFDINGGQMAVTGNPWPEFRAEGIDKRPFAGLVNGNTIRLFFSSTITGATGISYLSHSGPAIDFIHATTGLGAFTFYNVPLIPGDGEPGNFADAELVLTSDATQLTEQTTFSVEVILKNTGPTTLENVEVSIPLPRPILTYNGSVVGTTTTGEFDNFSDLWKVPSVAPRDSVLLTLEYYVQQAATPVTLWAEVLAADNEVDEDSSPGNGVPGEVSEDDEARIVIGNRSADCVFSVEPVQSACSISGIDTTWSFALEAYDLNPAIRIVEGLPGGNRTWSPTTNLAVALDLASLRRSNALPLQVEVVHANDQTCAARFELSPPQSCTGTVGNAGVEALKPTFHIWPNPLRRGQGLNLKSLAPVYAYNTPVLLVSATGQRMELPSSKVVDDSTIELIVNVPSGLYFLKVGDSVTQLIVLD